jgi:hypothetical protein
MFYIIVILAAIFAMPAKADETVKWRQVQHSTSIQTLEVGDGHTLNIFRLAGIVFFPDGTTGTSVVLGTSDVVNGSGSANGYGFITFVMARSYGPNGPATENLVGEVVLSL